MKLVIIHETNPL